MFFSLMLSGLYALCVLVVTYFFIIPGCEFLAFYFNFLDYPNGTIKIHASPTPYLGGVAVACIPLLSAWLLPFEGFNAGLYCLGLFVLLFVGLLDDRICLAPVQKLIGQISGVICLMSAGLHGIITFFLPIWFNTLVVFFYFLSLINAVNLIDIMDGLAATVVLSSVASFTILAFYFGNTVLVSFLMIVFASMYAFFLHNRPPKAKIYLGDAGALFCGGLLATIPFLFYPYSMVTGIGNFFTTLLFFIVPIFELCALIVIRTYKKILFYLGSPDHFAIYLRKKGWSKKGILVYVLLASSYFSGIALAQKVKLVSLGATIALFLLGLGVWIAVLRCKKVKN